MNIGDLQENALAQEPVGIMLRCGGTRETSQRTRFGPRRTSVKRPCGENIIAPLAVFASFETLRASLPVGWNLALAVGASDAAPVVGEDDKLHAPTAFFDVLCPVCTEALLNRLRDS